MEYGQLEEGFEQDLATLLIGVDSLWGGDALHESGAHHMIADTWTSGAAPPTIYHNPFSAYLRKTGGIVRGKDAKDVNGYVRKYALHDLAEKIRTEASEFDGDRRGYILNVVKALEVMLDTAVARVNKKAGPSFDELRQAATKKDNIELADPAPLREQLQDSLAKVGYEVTSSRNLRETFIAYENQGRIPTEEIAQKASATISQLLQLSRERLFPFLNGKEMPPPWKTVADVPFDGHEFRTISGQHFTGSSIYRGGHNPGRPSLQGLFEYNTDHYLSPMNLHHLCSHEVVPGHYLNAAIKDMLFRSGYLGFEATTATMCTSDAIFGEGWAQNTYELLYGSREKAISELGEDLRVFFAFEDLQDIGKHNVSILYMRERVPLSQVKSYIAEQCVQPDPIVKKLSGAWAQHPIIGPMYGAAYHYGKSVVNKAIQDKGIEKVTQIGFHFQGLVDIDTFQRKVYRTE